MSKGSEKQIKPWNDVDLSVFPAEFRRLLPVEEIRKLLHIGLYPKEILTVAMEQLFVQFRSEWPWQKTTANPKAYVSLPVVQSPIMALLELYQQQAERFWAEEKFKETLYYGIWQQINQIGFRYDWYSYPNKIAKYYSDKDIQRKIQRLLAVFKSIREYGYRGVQFENRMITVLQEPFENTRFNFEHQMDGYEIWSGHHRVAAMAALGMRKVEILLLEDIRNSKT